MAAPLPSYQPNYLYRTEKCAMFTHRQEEMQQKYNTLYAFGYVLYPFVSVYAIVCVRVCVCLMRCM